MDKKKKLFTVEYEDQEYYVVAGDMVAAIELWKWAINTEDEPDNIIFIDEVIV
jgi:hypothetical protein